MSDAFNDHDFDPDLADLVVDAFETHVDVDTASRHLWAIHHEASQVFMEQGLEPAASILYSATQDGFHGKGIEALLAKARLPEDLSELEGLSETSALDVTDVGLAKPEGVTDFLDSSLQPPVDIEDGRVRFGHQLVFGRWSASFTSKTKASRQRSLGRKLLAVAGAPALSVALMVGMSSAGLAMASQSSRPGDLLYTLKRGTEQARLAITSDETARAELHLVFANERLKELRDVGPVNPEVVASLVTEIGASLNAATDSTAEERIRRAAIEEVKHLETVAPLPVAIAIPSALTPVAKPVPVLQILEERPETPAPAAQPGVVASAPEESHAPSSDVALIDTNVKGKPAESAKPVSEPVRVSESAKPIVAKPLKPSEAVAKPSDSAEVPQAVSPTSPPADTDNGRRDVVNVEAPKPNQSKPTQPEPKLGPSASPKPSVKPTPSGKPSAKPTPKDGAEDGATERSATVEPKSEAPLAVDQDSNKS